MTAPFFFRSFDVVQDQSAHKVGTDSVLLGAWTKTNASTILDIGTGTGLLALMMAQNHPDATIDAIEPEPNAFFEASNNFHRAPFAGRLTIENVSLQEFRSKIKFDLIISNPPYHAGQVVPKNNERLNARHAVSLPIPELYRCAANLLGENGIISFIFPFEDEGKHLQHAASKGLFPCKILRTVRSDGKFERTLIQAGFTSCCPSEEQLLVKDNQNRYSSEYISLTQEFYSKSL